MATTSDIDIGAVQRPASPATSESDLAIGAVQKTEAAASAPPPLLTLLGVGN